MTTEFINIRNSDTDVTYKLSNINGGNEVYFDGVKRNRLYEQKILIKNLIDSTYSIDVLQMGSKINFSLPSSQFPIQLTPFDIDTISVVLYSENSSDLKDVIYNNIVCKTELIKLRAEFGQESFEFIDKCGMVWHIGETSKINLSKPYPNPANNWIKINYIDNTNIENLSEIKITMRDSYGTELKSQTTISTNNIEINLDNNYETGIYFIDLRFGNSLKIIPVIIVK